MKIGLSLTRSIAEKRKSMSRLSSRILLAGVIASAHILPVAAQVRLGPEAGGANYSIQVMSWWEIPFRSVVRQRFDFSCGSAAVATLLTHQYGIKTPEDIPFKAMWEAGDKAKIKKAGFSMLDMKLYLQKNGYKVEGYKLSLQDFGTLKQPGIVLLNLDGYRHFVVLKGIEGDTVLIGDPVRGLNKYSLTNFGKAWNGIFLAITDTPQKSPAIFNLATDWDPWAKSPLRNHSRDATIGSLTDNLAPRYQITPNILLDVRVGTVP
jgi:predicted double-glycine peptidase